MRFEKMNNKRLTYFLLFLITCFPLYSYSVSLTNKTKNHLDYIPLISNTLYNDSWVKEVPNINKMIIDSEDNIYVTGFIGDYDTAGITLSKYNSSGDLLWQNIWDEYDRESLQHIRIDNSGNIYLAGNTESFTYFKDILILKYQSNGDLLWNITWGDEMDFNHMGGFEIDSEDSFYLTMYDDYEWTQDIRVIKFNSSGTLIWDHTRKEVGKQVLNYKGLDASDNLFLSYKTEYNDEETWYFLKYDQSGNQLWIREKEEIGTLEHYRISIDQNDNIILRGEEYDEIAYIKFFKYNTSGHQIWNKTILNPSGFIGYYRDGFDNTGNYYFSSINDTNGYIIKYNYTIEQIWISNYQRGEFIGDLLIDYDQNVYVIADISIPSERMSNDIYITKLNRSGNFMFNLTWGGSRQDDIRASKFDSKNNLYMIIRSYSQDGYIRYLVKNPIDNNKSLEPGPQFYDIYFIIFLAFTGVISILSLKTILKNYKNRNSK